MTTLVDDVAKQMKRPPMEIDTILRALGTHLAKRALTTGPIQIDGLGVLETNLEDATLTFQLSDEWTEAVASKKVRPPKKKSILAAGAQASMKPFITSTAVESDELGHILRYLGHATATRALADQSSEWPGIGTFEVTADGETREIQLMSLVDEDGNVLAA